MNQLAALPFLIAIVVAPSEPPAVKPVPVAIVKDAPAVQVFLPGFTVRELPVTISNLTCVQYSPDGRLFAGGYDGRMHLLRDSDGDGLEDAVTTFVDKKGDDFPLGAAWHDRCVVVGRGDRIVRYRDTDGDGVPDKEEVVATGWTPKEKDPKADNRRVVNSLGFAIAADGSIYTAIGTAYYSNAYQLDKAGKHHYDPKTRRGVILKISPDGKTIETHATGVRVIVAMAFNKHGDLFATDQEGATWLPNGNPFDELLHIQPGRHYGFPPRHPKYLPDVIDEPSVFDYGPQHQSTCGFRFNEPAPGGKPFGPPSWNGDAIVVGQSRGKLYRTQLVKSAAGYVARNTAFASLGMLATDCAISPRGDLVVCCHSGPPDWGTGPAGMGKLFKISYTRPEEPQPILTWAASPTETQVEFDRPLDPLNWKNLAAESRIEGGAYVAAGDRFERLRPGYEVVKQQQKAERFDYPVLSAGMSGNGIVVRTPARSQAMPYSLTLPFSMQSAEARTMPRSAGLDLAVDLTGVQAEWRSTDGRDRWAGWLPHVDWQVAMAMTAGSATHDRLRHMVQRPGQLTLRGQLDLTSMLRAAVQPGARLDFEYPPESVTVRFRSDRLLLLSSRVARATGATLTTTAGESRWVPFELLLPTNDEPKLAVSWSTSEDSRPRALPLRRVLLPWAQPPTATPADAVRTIPEIAGGDWEAGKKVFFGDKAICSKCHAIRSEGATLGPDLSNLIFRDYESVLKDVREPSATLNPDYLTYTVTLDDGRTLTGVLNGSDEKTLKIADAAGKVTTVPRASATTIAPMRTSVMPEKALDGLSEQQRKDLFTFLLMAK